MDSSIHTHFISAKLQDDMRVATGARIARQAREDARKAKSAAQPASRRGRFFRRAPTFTVSAR